MTNTIKRIKNAFNFKKHLEKAKKQKAYWAEDKRIKTTNDKENKDAHIS